MTRRNRHKAAKKPRQARVGQDLARALQLAVDAALTAHVLLLGLPPDLPHEGFDKALMADPDHKAARQAFGKIWKRIFTLLPDQTAKRHLFALEEAASDLAIAAATTGWRLGIAARGAARVKGK
jgi:hypothetical protein